MSTDPDELHGTAAEGDVLPWRSALVSGSVFLASGASLVVHILTGAPLGAVLAVLVTGGAVAVAVMLRARADVRRRWWATVRVGVVCGLVSTAAYDLSRWALVTVGGLSASPFVALPFFGNALMGDIGGSPGRMAAGIGFHLLNGVAFATAYTVWFGDRGPLAGVAFALVLEAFMLALYPGWLDVRSVAELTQISVFGHVVYGITLGYTARWGRRRWVDGEGP